MDRLGFFRRRWLIATALILASPAMLAETRRSTSIEEIIVTADIRERNQLELAGSISTISDERIRNHNAKHLEEILSLAANVNLSQGSNRARFYQIRGLGERAQFVERINPSVGLLIDGVDFSGAGTIATLFDVQQVEVLRGPQSTRYGSSALAGLINIQTKDPTLDYSGHLEADASNYNSFSLGVVHSGPIIPGRLLYRATVQKNQSDGFIENQHLGRDDTNKQDELLTRVKLRWFLYEALTLDFQAGYVDVDNGYDAFSLDNSRNTLSDQPGVDQQESLHAGLKLTMQGAQTKLVLLANFSDSDINYGYDEDWVFDGFDPSGYNSTDYYQRDRQTRSAELRWLSNPDKEQANKNTEWLVGLYYLGRTIDFTREYFTPFSSDYGTKRYAAYSEINQPLGQSQWSLSIGLRGELWEADYREPGLQTSPDDFLWGGRVVLQYQPQGSTMWYGSLVRGYKAGGFNADPRVPREFDSEVLYSLEAGLKKHWLSGRLGTYLTLFYMNRDDLQIKSSFTIPRTPDSGPQFVEYVGNAASGHNAGLEFELAYQPNSSWQINASLGLLQTEYTKFINANRMDISGRDQAHAPKWQYAVSAQYHLTPGWSLGFSAQGRDAFYFSDSHNARSEDGSWFNTRLSYQSDKLGIALWVRNLTDEDIETRGFFFGNDPRTGYSPTTYTQLGEPRRLGVTVNLDF